MSVLKYAFEQIYRKIQLKIHSYVHSCQFYLCSSLPKPNRKQMIMKVIVPQTNLVNIVANKQMTGGLKAQSDGQCLLYKHEEQSLDRLDLQKGHVNTSGCSSLPVIPAQREDPHSKLLNGTGHSRKFWGCLKDSVSKRVCERAMRMLPNTNRRIPHAQPCMCKQNVHIRMHSPSFLGQGQQTGQSSCCIQDV